MKKFIRDYTDFNLWANERMGRVIVSLSEEQMNMPMKSSFPTIRETILHIWSAQDIWLERFDGVSPTSWPMAGFLGSKEELVDKWIESSIKLKEKVRNYSKSDLKKEVAYTTLKGISGKSTVFEMFAHVCNHGTYHRGQLITMFRVAGLTEAPATDIIAFFRENKMAGKPKKNVTYKA
jgi:uncharacterized damage-inducible protein DinB